MSASINKITVFKLKNDDISEIQFDRFAEIKNDQYSFDGQRYPYRLFFYRHFLSDADWLPLFDELNLGLAPDLKPVKLSNGFIFLIKTNKSYYALTGGVGHMYLKKAVEIEHGFGLDIAQKILSVQELRGLAQKDTSGIVNSLDRVFRGKYNPSSDVNNLKRVLTHVRGKLKKDSLYIDKIGKSFIASDSFTVNGSKTLDSIVVFLQSLDEVCDIQTKQISIPQLAHINKKASAGLIRNLMNQLVHTISIYSADDNSLFLDNEDIGYLPDRAAKYQVIYKRRQYDCATYTDVFEKVAGLLQNISENDRVEEFSRINLGIFFDDGNEERRDLFYFICGDIIHENEVYFINNRQWYKASEDFIRRLDEEIDNVEFITPEELELLEWNEDFADERSYNSGQQNHLCLDRKLVRIAAEKGGIEFCDLLRRHHDTIELLHVKNDCGAALRALFAQGFVAVKLYDEDNEFRQKVCSGDLQESGHPLTAQQKQILMDLATMHKRDIKLVYCIFDNKDSHWVRTDAVSTSEKLKGTLTTFAKVDLLERASSVRAMGYGVAVTRIKPYIEAPYNNEK